MALYTVHVPDMTPDLVKRADLTRFVREGFNGWAFLFGGLFLLWHRLWLPVVLWIAALAVLVGLGSAAHLPPGPAMALGALLHLFVGVEGNDLRRWGLARRGFRMADVVSGARRDDAEYAFFAGQPEEPAATRAPSPRYVVRNATPAVIGMFPEDGSP